MNNKKVKIALLGASGNMGAYLFSCLAKEEFVSELQILNHDPKGTRKIIRKNRKYSEKFIVIDGSIAEIDKVREVIRGVDYVLNLAAAIPPESDKYPNHAIEANEVGPKILVQAIEEVKDNQPKLIHISTMGIYGDRGQGHLFGEVGDPLLISPFDLYALTKMRGEFTILESDVKYWTVIRQTAMFYDEMLSRNKNDGLMFHTCVNSPLEWSTGSMSALLIRNIIKKDIDGDLNFDNFWKHCFNLGGGEANRITGYETVCYGFKCIGAQLFDMFEPNYVSLRNFHGVWFSDGQKLEELFHYQGETVEDFWNAFNKKHWYFGIAKILPKKWLKAMAIKPILDDSNAPMYWYKHKDEARMLAYFNGSNIFESLPKSWKDYNILALGKDCNGNAFDYEYTKHNPTRINHYFDIDKDRKLLDINDLRNVAEAHGGKLISSTFKTGDIFAKVEWENSDGERFIACPHTVLYCGHWLNISYKEHAWDFDRLSKKDKIYAQIWYDQHDKNEDRFYYFDQDFNAHYKNI